MGVKKMCKQLFMCGMLNEDDIKQQVSQNVRCQNGTRVSKHWKFTSNYHKSHEILKDYFFQDQLTQHLL
jgi:hypothetical protein